MSFFEELKRRKVFRVAIAYLVVAWVILQVGDTLAPVLRLPDWVNTTLVFFLILGFPLAIFFAWAFELTPEGLRRETGGQGIANLQDDPGDHQVGNRNAKHFSTLEFLEERQIRTPQPDTG